ncbi:DUF6984 family protein [Cupriavidus basilensis]|uniref:DUF6984 domain-containing protein n=1 Tax=Cupriavidus basilensis TaxID=68895 RepID=A0A643FMW4_9BURK|nr:hypothetical protein [Cupriavidus basilensis]QOT79041.1 hypothetical protein F7R26_030175 [Cupriavidus basilensis]
MKNRNISAAEFNLLGFLGKLGQVEGRGDFLMKTPLEVQPMEDGGMGSFRICLPNQCEKNGHETMVASAQALDKDGTLVFATLFVDSQHRPIEVDIWKVDYSQMLEMPSNWIPERNPPLPGGGE